MTKWPSGSQSMHIGNEGKCTWTATSLAVEIHGNDFVRSPIGEPQPVVMPSRRFAKRQTRKQDFHFGVSVSGLRALRLLSESRGVREV
jgi:hypothetical protein